MNPFCEEHEICTNFRPMFLNLIRYGLIAFSAIYSVWTQAQGDPAGGARSAALGSASVALQDVWSGFNNQAGLASLDKVAGGIFLENRFLVSELTTRGLALALPTNSGVFALSMRNFGYSLYNEGVYGLAYGRKLGDNLSAGLEVDYLTTRIGEGYGSTSAVSFQLGFQFRVNPDLHLAGHASNPARAKLSGFNDERYPSLLRIGASYKIGEKVLMVSEVAKDMDMPAMFRAGIEYHPAEILYIRAGVGGNSFNSSFGFGLDFQTLRIDFASAYSATLGYSPQFSVSYNVK
jgi:hypothetical protein